MIACFIALALLAAVILMLVKFKKVNTALKVLFVFLIVISVSVCVFVFSQQSLPIQSLPLKALPQNFEYKIPQEKIEKIELEENKNYRRIYKYFNEMEFAYCKENLMYYQSDEPLSYVNYFDDQSGLSENVPNSCFDMYYFDFYTDENAREAMNDLMLSDFMPMHMYYMDRRIDSSVTCDGNRTYYTGDVPARFIKASENPNIVSTYTVTTAHTFTGNPLLACLVGDKYRSLCAFRDGRYILIVCETTYHRETNLFSMLGDNPTGKVIVLES